MGFKLFDFQCNQCQHEFEELEDETGLVKCNNCGSFNTTKVISAPNLNTMNLLSKEEYKAKLKKRSLDHTKKMMKQEGERYGVKGVKNG